MQSKDKAYDVLRQRLVGGHYSPGTQLKEEPIAEELGLSRTPVRAALKRLVDEGLATSSDGQGIRVSRWNDRDIEETYQLRMLLEPYAASSAATRCDATLVLELEACNKDMDRAIRRGGVDSLVDVQQANRRFHRALLNAAGSPRLRLMLEAIVDLPILVRSFYVYTADDLLQSLHHHRELTVAVGAHDAELARLLMQLHLKVAHLRFMKHRNEYARTQ